MRRLSLNNAFMLCRAAGMDLSWGMVALHVTTRKTSSAGISSPYGCQHAKSWTCVLEHGSEDSVTYSGADTRFVFNLW